MEIGIALAFLILSLLAAFVWVPLDSETPPIYEFRRRTYIGDAMMPMLAALGMALCAAVHLAVILWRRREETPPSDTVPPFDALTLRFFVLLVVIVAVSVLLIFQAGPAALALFGPPHLPGDEATALTYRHMRDTAPWKYIGFVLGGFVMVFGITTLIEGRARWRRAVAALVAVGVLIAVFDLPFDDLLLPPNGDF